MLSYVLWYDAMESHSIGNCAPCYNAHYVDYLIIATMDHRLQVIELICNKGKISFGDNTTT